MPSAPRSCTTRRSSASRAKADKAATIRKFLALRAQRQREFFAAAKGAGLDDIAARRLLLAIRSHAGPVVGVVKLVDKALGARVAA